MTPYDAVGAFGDLTIQHLQLQGKGLSADLVEKITAAQVTRSIEQASTVKLTLGDEKRQALANKLLAQRSRITLAGKSFTLVQVSKQGPLVSCTFEDTDVNALRQIKTPRSFQAGISRPQAAAQLARAVPGLKFAGDPNAPATQEALAVGVKQPDGTLEDWWTGLLRWADEVQDRCFIINRTLHFGADKWLLTQSLSATLAEHQAGIDYIDFDHDIGKPNTAATVYGYARLWAGEPGRPIKVQGVGVGSGTYLVQSISRDLMRSPVTIQLVGPKPELPEPSAASTSIDPTTGLPIPADGTTGSKVTGSAVSLLGTPYKSGGTTAKGVDCSGLTQLSYQAAGITIPRTAAAQWAASTKVPQGSEQPGDLAFFTSDGTPTAPGHVGVYIGSDQMIDAPHTGTVVRYDPVSTFGGFIGFGRFP